MPGDRKRPAAQRQLYSICFWGRLTVQLCSSPRAKTEKKRKGRQETPRRALSDWSARWEPINPPARSEADAVTPTSRRTAQNRWSSNRGF